MRARWEAWARRAIVVLAIAVPIAAVAIFLAIEASSQPPFCGSCHIMKPYYESWLASSHREVPCVDCHIPPGITSEMQKKYEALSMVTRYFTGTYSTHPWAEVPDESCLRSGCHVTRVLIGRELYQGVLFDHRPHLTELRRGKQLRCTSCHSQIVQGSHIAVTPSTCFLCHFKNTTPNEGTARCTLCHEVPEKIVTTAGLSFDHAEVKRLDMPCMACHEGVVKGDGDAPRQRCFSCHAEPARLELYKDPEALHRIHVTDHKVECLHCHVEIRHGVPAREEALAGPCASCHTPASGHAAVRNLYRGIGGHGAEPRPAAMYLAGVRCEACHNREQGDHRVADEVSCMGCHGPRYLTIYRTWQAGLGERIRGLRAEIDRAGARLGHADGVDPLAGARASLTLVDGGRAIHNPPYAVELIGRAHHEVVDALGAAGEPPAAAPPWTEAPYRMPCLDCHFGIELVPAHAFGEEFPHGPHVVAARLRCTTCHADGEPHGRLRLAASDCRSCHERTQRPMSGVEAEGCLACHAADLGPVSEKIVFPHEKHIGAGLDCTLCHQHVADVPHRRLARTPGAVPKLGHEFCATCHAADVPTAAGEMPDGANCQTCHLSF